MRRTSTRVCSVSACNHTQTYMCTCQHRSTGHQTCVHDGHTCTHIDAGTYASTRAHARVTPERSGRQKGAERRGRRAAALCGRHRASPSGSCTRTEQREAPRQKGEKQACAHLRPAHLRPDSRTPPDEGRCSLAPPPRPRPAETRSRPGPGAVGLRPGRPPGCRPGASCSRDTRKELSRTGGSPARGRRDRGRGRCCPPQPPWAPATPERVWQGDVRGARYQQLWGLRL